VIVVVPAVVAAATAVVVDVDVDVLVAADVYIVVDVVDAGVADVVRPHVLVAVVDLRFRLGTATAACVTAATAAATALVADGFSRRGERNASQDKNGQRGKKQFAD
jgi:hypothetical protein